MAIFIIISEVYSKVKDFRRFNGQAEHYGMLTICLTISGDDVEL